MDHKTILKYFDGVDQESVFTINCGAGRQIIAKKDHIQYDIENDTDLMIFNKRNRKIDLINIESIRHINIMGDSGGDHEWRMKTQKFMEDKIKMDI